jgi:hypothetical protein
MQSSEINSKRKIHSVIPEMNFVPEKYDFLTVLSFDALCTETNEKHDIGFNFFFNY